MENGFANQHGEIVPPDGSLQLEGEFDYVKGKLREALLLVADGGATRVRAALFDLTGRLESMGHVYVAAKLLWHKNHELHGQVVLNLLEQSFSALPGQLRGLGRPRQAEIQNRFSANLR